MGTPLAPHYANVFMERLETNTVNKWHIKPICHEKGPFLRIRRKCSKNKDFIKNGIKMIEHYIKRGYNFKQKPHMLIASKFTQDGLREVKAKETISVMTTTYNPRNLNIKEFIHNN